jgi:uncharacterized protein YqjF (DUF2071 family)
MARRNPRPFLTAEWRQLAMLNFEIDPDALQPLVPVGTQLDQWQGRSYISLVGFLFLNTRVLSVAVPGHRNFEEVNLRFYVRREVGDEVRRGVVFVKEIVPRRAIALTARALYGERYVYLPMGHRIAEETQASEAGRSKSMHVEYSWRYRDRANRLALTTIGEPQETPPDSEAEFITEHYWGYAHRGPGRTTEYQVEHPRWRTQAATDCDFDCDVAGIYGEQFVAALREKPTSAFLAEGSPVIVRWGTPIGDRTPTQDKDH